jgi:X-Pro dipeptidyl-peptidase
MILRLSRPRLLVALASVLAIAAAANATAVAAPAGLGQAAPAPAPAVARPTYSTFHFEEDHVAMRDGVKLDVNIWIPDVPAGTKVPVILTLTPYGILDNGPQPWSPTTLPDSLAQWTVPLGYARAFADVRGTRNSEGCYDYGGLAERHDGYDLVEWLGTQSWSSGNVGMVGTSYEGTTANAAASEHPPHLKAIVPIAAINKWYDYAYEKGTRFFLNSEVPTDEGIDTPAGFTYGFGIIPPFDPSGNPQNIVTRLSPCDRTAQDTHGYSLEPDYDQYWRDRDYLAAEASSGIPTWIVHGLQDNNVRTWEGTEVWEALPPGTPKKLWLGQWPHADGSSRSGPEWKRQMIAWWDRYLMGLDSGIDREPAVDVQFNDGTWHTEATWPPADNGPVSLVLHPRPGEAGGLDLLPPKGEGAETFFDDPTLSENRMLAAPDSPDPARLTYRTEPLRQELRVAGRPYLDLWARSDQPGTHISVLLVDVAPGGGWTIVHRGFGNARYRGGLDRGADISSGVPYEFQVPVLDDDYTFAAGHSIGLVVSSSNLVWALPSEYRANNTVLHQAGMVSSLVIPVQGGAATAQKAVPPSAPARHLPNTAAMPPGWAPAVGGLALMGAAAATIRRRRRTPPTA